MTAGGRPDRLVGPDDGAPDPRLAAALAAYDGTPATRTLVLAALAGARVFLALSARPLGAAPAGPAGSPREVGAQLSLVTVVAADGRRALPAFADGRAVQRWRSEARPVALDGPAACRSALDDGAVALLLEPAAARLVLAGDELRELAAGRVPVAGRGLSTRVGPATLVGVPVVDVPLVDVPVVDAPLVDTPLVEAPLADAARVPGAPVPDALVPDALVPDPLVRALAAALAGEPVCAARLLTGPEGPVLGVVPSDPLSPAQLVALAARVREHLGGALPAGGLDLAVVPSTGPGTAIDVAAGGPGRGDARGLRRRLHGWLC